MKGGRIDIKILQLLITICFNEVLHLTFCGKTANLHTPECQGNVVCAELFSQDLRCVSRYCDWFRYGIEDRSLEVRFPARERESFLIHNVQTDRPLFPLSFVSKIAAKYFPKGKVAVRESDHSSPSSAEDKNAWSYIFMP